MRIVLIGDADDVRGFALAGIAGHSCHGRRETEAALAQVTAEQPPVGLILISAAVAHLCSERIAALRARDDAPVLIVLPESQGARSVP